MSIPLACLKRLSLQSEPPNSRLAREAHQPLQQMYLRILYTLFRFSVDITAGRAALLVSHTDTASAISQLLEAVLQVQQPDVTPTRCTTAPLAFPNCVHVTHAHFVRLLRQLVANHSQPGHRFSRRSKTMMHYATERLFHGFTHELANRLRRHRKVVTLKSNDVEQASQALMRFRPVLQLPQGLPAAWYPPVNGSSSASSHHSPAPSLPHNSGQANSPAASGPSLPPSQSSHHNSGRANSPAPSTTIQDGRTLPLYPELPCPRPNRTTTIQDGRTLPLHPDLLYLPHLNRPLKRAHRPGVRSDKGSLRRA